MSLKAFHVVFIAASVMLCLGFAGWSFGNYREMSSAKDLYWGVASVLAAVGLLVYGRYFLRKLKNISYL
jgi:hypothetical protein